MRLFSFLIDKNRIEPRVVLDGEEIAVAIPPGTAHGDRGGRVEVEARDGKPAAEGEGPAVEMPLIRIAHGRSGDKGDSANIGVIARDAAFVEVIAREVTAEKVATWLSHYCRGPVRRFALPGLNAFNFICERALDGGVAASLRGDPWGKGLAQVLLSMPVRVPARLANLAAAEPGASSA